MYASQKSASFLCSTFIQVMSVVLSYTALHECRSVQNVDGTLHPVSGVFYIFSGKQSSKLSKPMSKLFCAKLFPLFSHILKPLKPNFAKTFTQTLS